MNSDAIGGVGKGHVQLHAEVGSVHDGSFGNAKKMIKVAADCGASAVKFQAHIARFETTRDAPAPNHFKDEARYSYFERLEFSESQWEELVSVAHEEGLAFVASPFSLEALAMAIRVGVDQIKIASGETTNLPLLRDSSTTGKPILLSSGMSNWEELDGAVNAVGRSDVTILQCSSLYPCPPERVGLNLLNEIRDRYDLPVGFSDHTDGISAAIAAVTLGARVVEKHLTFSKLMYGSDAPYACEPKEFANLAKEISEVTTMLHSPVDKDDLSLFEDTRRVFQNSVVAVHDLDKGHRLQAEDLTLRKPGTGMSALELGRALGRTLLRPISAGSQLTDGDFE